jgi:hypothetical protein
MPDGFVTVSEAARALGISDRQALRYAGRLSDADRRASETGPTRVRLEALRALRGERQNARSPREEVHGTSDAMSDAGPTSVRPGPTHDGGHASDAASNALVEQLKGEVAFLRAALEREQETARAALAELHEERQRAAVLITAAATGRLVAPEMAGANARRSPADVTGDGNAAAAASDQGGQVSDQDRRASSDSGRAEHFARNVERPAPAPGEGTAESRNPAQETPGPTHSGESDPGRVLTPSRPSEGKKPGLLARLFGQRR